VCTSITSRLIWISSQIFIQTTRREPRVIVGTIFGTFGRPAPKIWEGEKRSKSGAISHNFRLWSRISPECIQKSRIEKVADQPHGLLRWAEKVGELWSKNKRVIEVHIDPPKWTLFGRLYFGPYWGMCSHILYALETVQDLLTHTRTETVSPPNLKFGLKFSVCATITSGIVGILSLNFSRPRDELWSTNEKVIARILIYPNCSYTVSWRKSIRHVALFGVIRHLPLLQRNFDYLNRLSTWTCGAGRPHVWLCHALLVVMSFAKLKMMATMTKITRWAGQSPTWGRPSPSGNSM